MEKREPPQLAKKRGHRPKLDFMEQKVGISHTVKRKHYDKAMKAIRVLCKKWR